MHIGKYILDLLMPPLRLQALLRVMKGYRPTINLAHALHLLGFITNSIDSVKTSAVMLSIMQTNIQEGIEFLTQAETQFIRDIPLTTVELQRNVQPTVQDYQNWSINSKDSIVNTTFILKKENLL